MNLYVYTLNTFFSNRPKGIHMEKVEATVRLQKERLENAENVLKIINESEEN